ncbi:MAG: glycosyltransferase, partial [Bacteroidales bacterium]|nr:glycosyltransferase [Bacteroidales bacterium]
MARIAFINKWFREGGVAEISLRVARYFKSNAPDLEVFVFTSHVFRDQLPPDVNSILTVVQTEDYPSAIKAYGIDILVQNSTMERNIDEIRATGVKVVFANHGEPFHQRYEIMDRRKGGQRRVLIKRILWEILLKYIYDTGGKAMRMAIKRTTKAYRKCDAFICLCEPYRQTLLNNIPGASPDRIFSIENPVIPVPDPTLEKEKSILYCGRLSNYDKRPDRLLRIWAMAQKQLPDYRLDIVGDGYERQRLEALAGKLGLERCTFHGHHTDTDPFYRKADVICLVSETEGWPLSLTEAQAHGTIPLSYDTSDGVRLILSDGAGFTVPKGDQKAFASELVR